MTAQISLVNRLLLLEALRYLSANQVRRSLVLHYPVLSLLCRLIDLHYAHDRRAEGKVGRQLHLPSSTNLKPFPLNLARAPAISIAVPFPRLQQVDWC